MQTFISINVECNPLVTTVTCTSNTPGTITISLHRLIQSKTNCALVIKIIILPIVQYRTCGPVIVWYCMYTSSDPCCTQHYNIRSTLYPYRTRPILYIYFPSIIPLLVHTVPHIVIPHIVHLFSFYYPSFSPHCTPYSNTPYCTSIFLLLSLF